MIQGVRSVAFSKHVCQNNPTVTVTDPVSPFFLSSGMCTVLLGSEGQRHQTLIIWALCGDTCSCGCCKCISSYCFLLCGQTVVSSALPMKHILEANTQPTWHWPHLSLSPDCEERGECTLSTKFCGELVRHHTRPIFSKETLFGQYPIFFIAHLSSFPCPITNCLWKHLLLLFNNTWAFISVGSAVRLQWTA